MPFKLPPKITTRKEKHGNHWVYQFQHQDLGRIGRVVLKPTPNGKTEVVCELVGDPSDPMYDKRAAIFKPLGIRLANAMNEVTAGGKPIDKSYFAPVLPTTRGKHIARKLMQCERCNAPIGFIILAPDAVELGELEDYARLMYSEIAKYDVPAWVVGGVIPSAGVDSSKEARCVVRKIYPDREAVFYASPDEFNALTDEVRTGCC